MKNFIKSNYNIYPKKMYKEENYYYFFSNNEKIYIIKSNKDKKYIDNIVNVSNEIYNYNKRISTFLLNINGEFYTKKDNYYIILLKYNDIYDKEIYIDDIDDELLDNKNIEEYNIIKEFENEIDTLEKEMTEYNKEYPLIQKSINYFIGLSENGIQLLKTLDSITTSICHNIELEKYNRFELNNPFNIIKTNIMFDYANYFKYKLYYSNIDYEELYKIININNKNNLIYFFSILLYQKEYFDMVKKVLLNKEKEEKIKKYIINIENYKEMILFVKDNLKWVDEIQQIEWLDK